MTKPHVTPVREGVLEASIETLKAENEILRRQLAAAEGRAARKPRRLKGRSPSFRPSSIAAWGTDQNAHPRLSSSLLI